MIASPGKPDAVSLTSGVGHVRAHTIALGGHVIAIDNIGTIRIVRGQRSWWLFVLGVLIIGGAATQLNTYGAIAIAGIGLGLVFILADLSQKVESGLCIGTADGRSTLIVSRDQNFLQRLLQILVDKIDRDDETLLASFDIAHGTITSVGTSASVGRDVLVSNAPFATPQPASPAPAAAPVADPAPEPQAAEDPDDGLFGDADPANDDSKRETPSAEPPAQPAPEPAPNVVRAPVQAERRKPFDPLLDGGPKPAANDDDWISRPRASSSPPPKSDGAAGRVLLALLIVALLGAGVFAAWYFTGQTGPATSISILASPQEAEAEPSPPAVAPPPAQPLIETVAPLETPLAPAPEAIPPANPAPTPESEIEAFTPPAPLVARASGQRYRARPSMADDVPVLAETRAGGEALQITGRLIQPDGEWYQVTLPDNRSAWFKASLAVPRARFAQSIGIATSTPGASFAASSPQILEPAEGAQFGGGPQPVLLAWSHRDDAVIYVVEIEAFDSATQRWIEDPLHRRATVDDGTELSEDFPSAGAWRWRVRGATSDGQQSQFSRWSAFAIRN